MIEFKADIDIIKKDLLNVLLVIEKHLIKGNLEHIKLCDDIATANKYFDIIEETLQAIERFEFRHEIDIGEYLSSAVKYFDRIDDDYTREYYFNKLKSQEITIENIWKTMETERD